MKLKSLLIIFALLLTTAVYAADSKPQTGRVVEIKTSKGTIKFALYEKDAPKTTQNFINLVNKKFYDGLTFHRVDPGFVIQGGDPRGNGSGSSDKTIQLEVSPKLKHDDAGVVAMARTRDPDSASCQFYITLGPASFLDMKYAVFGRVTQGLDVVKKIEIGDVMKSVRIVSAAKKTDTVKKSEPKTKKSTETKKTTAKKTTKKTVVKK